METLQNEKGFGGNHQTNLKEVEHENFTTVINEPTEEQQLAVKNAADQLQMKDKEMKVEVKKTDQDLDILVQNADSIDMRTKGMLLENKPLLRKFFPTKMDKLLNEMQRNEVKESMTFRLNLYKLASQYRLDSVRELYNSRLMVLKGHYRQQVASFMMSKLQELNHDVESRQYTFIEMIKQKYAYLGTLSSYPAMAKRYEVQIEREQDRFFVFLEQLLIKYEGIINEELKKFN